MANFGPWVAANDRLPRDGDIVLVCCEDGTYLLAAYDEGWREPWEGPLDDVAYWCELPELPRELAFLDAVH
ncbi:MAG: hypothetical protein ACREX4_17000 [Gammaproteobacteria bacterium]